MRFVCAQSGRLRAEVQTKRPHASARATVVDGMATPTVTGVLLAGMQGVIQRVVPTSQAPFQVLQGTEVRVNQDLDGALLRTIEKMREMLEPWNPECNLYASMVYWKELLTVGHLPVEEAF